MIEIGDVYQNKCPYCGSIEIKFWGAGPIGSVKNPYELLESLYTCKECRKTFCTVNGKFSYLDEEYGREMS